MVLPGWCVHPLKKVVAKQQHRNKEKRQGQHQDRDVFQLAPNHHRPFRIDRVMDNDPEKAAGAEGEEIGKTEEPGKTELNWFDDRADDAKNERDKSDAADQDGEPGKAIRFEELAFRLG